MRSLLFFTCLIFFAELQSAEDRSKANEYIEKYKEIAIQEMERSGVPASITLAQGMLESAYGNSKLARKAKNHFGIKCHSNWTGPSIKKDDDAKNECFRKYKNTWESYRDHSNFLKNKSRYSFLFDYKTTDYKSWAKGLKKAGYATNPKYPKLLINLIEKHELYRYDKGESTPKRKREKEKKTPKSDLDSELSPVAIKTRVQLSENYVKYFVVKKGDTFRSLEKEFGIRKKRLLKYNERARERLVTGEILYLQPKKKAAKTKYYQVKRGETLYSISQKFAVTTKSILKRNNLGEEGRVKVKQKLKLRGRKIK